jgi:hypothetical protein
VWRCKQTAIERIVDLIAQAAGGNPGCGWHARPSGSRSSACPNEILEGKQMALHRGSFWFRLVAVEAALLTTASLALAGCSGGNVKV